MTLLPVDISHPHEEITMAKDDDTTDFYSFTMYYLLKSLLVYILFFILQAFRLRNEVFLVSPTLYPVEIIPTANTPGRVETSGANSYSGDGGSLETSESKTYYGDGVEKENSEAKS